MEEEKGEVKETSSINWSEVLTKADESASRIERANEESRKILQEQQELAARNLLGGRTDAGQEVKEEVKEESAQDYAQRVLNNRL